MVSSQPFAEGPARIVFDVDLREPVRSPAFEILVHDTLGEILLDLRSSNCTNTIGTVFGKIRIAATVRRPGLLPGHYVLSLWVNNERETADIDYVKACGSFQIFAPGAAARKGRVDRGGAKFWAEARWTIDPA